MKLGNVKLCAIIASLFILLSASAVYGLEIMESYMDFKPGSHHLELRDLGFESVDLIPADESAITSLVEAASGDIYGATTGPSCHLFVFTPFSERDKLLTNRVKHLGKIKGHESIHHSMVAQGEIIYFGTGLNELEQYPISAPLPGNAGITRAMWSDIKKRYAGYDGGHLYKFNPAVEKRPWIESDQECIAEDLGIPVPHNGIYAMAINNKRKEIYGLTYPDGHFFVYEIENAKFTDVGAVYDKTIYAGPDNRTLRTISRALICDDKGYVYGSADDAKLFRYDPKEKRIEKLDVQIPAVYFTAVEALVKDANGVIYGGTVEGYLFRFEPEKMKITNLGKPFTQLRIRTLAIGKDGIIYGIVGQRSNHCRAFSYNIAESSFDVLGVLRVIRAPYYRWTGKQFDAMVAGRDGIIYFGESERRSHLFMFYP